VLLLSSFASGGAELEPLLKGCATIRNDTERLACYDRVIAQLYSRSDNNPQPAPSPEAMFGAGAQTNPRPQIDEHVSEELSSITAHVAALRTAADGSQLIELDNGQLWKQEDARKLLLRMGDAVTISRAAMQSFKLSTPAQRFARVSRVR